MKNEIPCITCINDGVPSDEASSAVHVTEDRKYDIKGRKTGLCMRSGHHPHHGPLVIFLDTGEPARQIKSSPIETLYFKAPDPPKVWGREPSDLSKFGIRGLNSNLINEFLKEFPEFQKKLPSTKMISDAETNNDPIDMYPIFGPSGMGGLEVRIEKPKNSMRPGDSNYNISPGKLVRIIGEPGIYISDLYPKLVPGVVAVTEGAKDAANAAIDAEKFEWDSIVFCGCSASAKIPEVMKTIHTFFPGVAVVVIGDRDPAGTGFVSKMVRSGAIAGSLIGCKGKDYSDEPEQFKRLESLKRAVSEAMEEWRFRQENRPANFSVMDQLQREGLVKVDANGNRQASNRSITLKRIFDLDTYFQSFRRNLMGMRDYHDDKEITDEHVIEIMNYLDKTFDLYVGIEQLERQISLQCSLNSFHPVRDYLDSLPIWDGKDRYPLILENVLGASNTKLNRASLAIFHRGAVARIYVPGCKHDSILILKSSKQGTGKTSYGNCCTVNIPGAFVEGHEDVISKDGHLTMHGGWVIELGEIDRITTKKDAEILKNFLSRRVDSIRPPYGRRVIQMERRFVLFGTTNQGTFLMDTTGQRRFFVIQTGDKPFDLELLRSIIDQVWAQALAEYREGKPWWLDSKLEEEHQREMEVFQAEEPWTMLIGKALSDIKTDRMRKQEMLCEGVTVAEILEKMNIRAESQNRGQANRAAEILRNMNWWKLENQVWREHRRVRLWFPPQQEMLEEIAESDNESGRSADIKAYYSSYGSKTH